MHEWHEDAIIVGVSSILADDHDWRIREDGRGPWWAFIVQSPSAMKETMITLLDDQVIVGRDRIPGAELSIPRVGKSFQLEEMIDTDKALMIAQQSRVENGCCLGYISTDAYDGLAGKVIPLSWSIGYRLTSEGGKPLWIHIFINAFTGDVIRNDFLSP